MIARQFFNKAVWCSNEQHGGHEQEQVRNLHENWCEDFKAYVDQTDFSSNGQEHRHDDAESLFYLAAFPIAYITDQVHKKREDDAKDIWQEDTDPCFAFDKRFIEPFHQSWVLIFLAVFISAYQRV